MRGQHKRQRQFTGAETDRVQTVGVQQGSLALCEKQTYTVAEVHCVGVSGVRGSETQAAGGFALLAPLPAVLWCPDTLYKVSLRRLSLPTPEALTAALKKEHAKLPSRLEMLRNTVGKTVKLDAGRKLPEYTLEVPLFPTFHVAGNTCESDVCVGPFLSASSLRWTAAKFTIQATFE